MAFFILRENKLKCHVFLMYNIINCMLSITLNNIHIFFKK